MAVCVIGLGVPVFTENLERLPRELLINFVNYYTKAHSGHDKERRSSIV